MLWRTVCERSLFVRVSSLSASVLRIGAPPLVRKTHSARSMETGFYELDPLSLPLSPSLSTYCMITSNKLFARFHYIFHSHFWSEVKIYCCQIMVCFCWSSHEAITSASECPSDGISLVIITWVWIDSTKYFRNCWRSDWRYCWCFINLSDRLQLLFVCENERTLLFSRCGSHVKMKIKFSTSEDSRWSWLTRLDSTDSIWPHKVLDVFASSISTTVKQKRIPRPIFFIITSASNHIFSHNSYRTSTESKESVRNHLSTIGGSLYDKFETSR